MRILSFNGRTLSTLLFKLVDSQVPNKVTKALEDIQVGAKMCRGIDRNKSVSEDCLIEDFNDSVIARSFKCYYLITTENELCDECQRLVGIKKEVDLDHIDSVPKRPKEEAPNLFLVESLKDEEMIEA